MAVFEKDISSEEFELEEFKMMRVGYLELRVSRSSGLVASLCNLFIRVTKSSLGGVVKRAVEFALSRLAQDMTVNMEASDRLYHAFD